MPDRSDWTSGSPRRPSLPQRPKRDADPESRSASQSRTSSESRAVSQSRPARESDNSRIERTAKDKKPAGKRTARASQRGNERAAAEQAGEEQASAEHAEETKPVRPFAHKRWARNGTRSSTGPNASNGTRSSGGPKASTGPKSRTETSAESRERSAGAAKGKVSAQGHLRVSWLFLTVVAVAIIGAFTLSPTIALLIEQRSDIDALQSDIDARNENIAELRQQVANWDDPAYIQSQARDRLFYVFPGEQAYTVIDERDGLHDIDDTSVVDTELVTENIDWATVGYKSILMAGLTDLTPDQLRGNAVVVEGQ